MTTFPDTAAPTHATVLVCDDQPENIDVLRGILKRNYRVQIATSGIDALALVAASPPDLVLLDVSMPGMDGYQVCRQLKADPCTAAIPVIFVTALYSPEDESRGFEAGAVDYIIKPLSPPVVAARVSTHLALASQQRHLEQLVAQRTEELNKTRSQIIRRLSRAADYKDDETGNHVIRMANYARLLALAHGLSEQAAEVIFNAAPMHDIGKIGVPDHILRKTGKLDATEWVEMRKHPQIGAGIIGRHNDPLLATARLVALTHHEKWDGSGYPSGLAGEAIPLAGRIVALCDVFDALTTDRPYKQAWSVTEAMNYIKSQSGLHFDPLLTRQFLAIIPQILEVRDRYTDARGEVTVEA